MGQVTFYCYYNKTRTTGTKPNSVTNQRLCTVPYRIYLFNALDKLDVISIKKQQSKQDIVSDSIFFMAVYQY